MCMVPNTNIETVSIRPIHSFILGTRTTDVCFSFGQKTSTTCSELISLSRWIFSNQSPGNRSVPIVERRYVFRRRMILNGLSADAVETGMSSKTRRHLVTFGYKSELVIDRVSIMQSNLTFVAPHFTFQRGISRWNYWKSGKSPLVSVNIPYTLYTGLYFFLQGDDLWTVDTYVLSAVVCAGTFG